MEKYDFVVIGAGSAGLTGARFAAQLGVRVALVERSRTGGDCTWTGCVPSKALISVAKTAHRMRTAGSQGLDPVEPEVDFRRVMARVRGPISDIHSRESPETLAKEGIEVVEGAARFLDDHTVSAGHRTLYGRKILIATGAAPVVPGIPGLSDAKFFTYHDIWSIEDLPRHLLVVGGGPIGCELAQAFRRLGSRVTLIEALDRLLPQVPLEASSILSSRLAEEGAALRMGTPVESVQQLPYRVAILAGGDRIEGDVLLVAVGRRPNLDGLDLDEAGVAHGRQGVFVSSRLRTNKRHIYAAGDCTGGPQFTHYAGWQGFMAVRNALLPGASRGVMDGVPWAVFTDPEFAHTGMTEEQARERYGNRAKVCHWPMERVDRAVVEGDTAGFLRVIYKKNGTVLGATIVAKRAADMIHEWTLAIHRRMKIWDLARTIHVYPTLSMAAMEATTDIQVSRMLDGVQGRVIRGMARLATLPGF